MCIRDRAVIIKTLFSQNMQPNSTISHTPGRPRARAKTHTHKCFEVLECLITNVRKSYTTF